jgi:hypothetical protein
MADCNFEFQLNGTIEEIKTKIVSGIEKNNGEIEFTNDEGKFTIKHPLATIGGTISVSETNLSIRITEKPVFVPCEMIKTEVEKFFVK